MGTLVITCKLSDPLCCELDLEWKIIYVGSAESEEYDQTLDTVVVGPLIAGRHMFVFEVSSYNNCSCPFTNDIADYIENLFIYVID